MRLLDELSLANVPEPDMARVALERGQCTSSRGRKLDVRERNDCAGRCRRPLSTRTCMKKCGRVRSVCRGIFCGKGEDWLGETANVPNCDNAFAVAGDMVSVKWVSGNSVDFARRFCRRTAAFYG